jgi:hypothetical protein
MIKKTISLLPSILLILLLTPLAQSSNGEEDDSKPPKKYYPIKKPNYNDSFDERPGECWVNEWLRLPQNKVKLDNSLLEKPKLISIESNLGQRYLLKRLG